MSSQCAAGNNFREEILSRVSEHPAATHDLFKTLETRAHRAQNLAALLRNYDAHACLLRRLLLNAAALMPEAAVGYVLENVRNEYGNGDYRNNHQSQLQDLVFKLGFSQAEYLSFPIQAGVKKFISKVGRFYNPKRSGQRKAAVSAGAITATELLAIREFTCLQKAFAHHGLAHHIWFDHVTVEQSHSDDSLSLALFFLEDNQLVPAVYAGLDGVLDATYHLYDGLIATLPANSAPETFQTASGQSAFSNLGGAAAPEESSGATCHGEDKDADSERRRKTRVTGRSTENAFTTAGAPGRER